MASKHANLSYSYYQMKERPCHSLELFIVSAVLAEICFHFHNINNMCQPCISETTHGLDLC